MADASASTISAGGSVEPAAAACELNDLASSPERELHCSPHVAATTRGETSIHGPIPAPDHGAEAPRGEQGEGAGSSHATPSTPAPVAHAPAA